MDHAPHGTALIFAAAFILFGVYRRLRRSVGRQRVRPTAMLLRMALLAAAAVALALLPRLAPYARIEELVGIVAGAALALWGLGLTRFSSDGTVRYYTPNTWLGLAVSLVFIGRIAYRFVTLAPALDRPGGPPASMFAGAQTGLTLALFGLVAGYYLVYYAGVLRRSRVPLPSAPATEAA